MRERPHFNHAELEQLWIAISQYSENQADDEELPAAAERALDKLNAYMAGEPQPVPVSAELPSLDGPGLIQI